MTGPSASIGGQVGPTGQSPRRSGCRPCKPLTPASPRRFSSVRRYASLCASSLPSPQASSSSNVEFVPLQDLLTSTSNRPSLSSLALPKTPHCSLYPSLSSHVAPAQGQPLFYAASKYVKKHHPLALAFMFVLLLKRHHTTSKPLNIHLLDNALTCSTPRSSIFNITRLLKST